jgi:arylsulfatase A-like enzyme
MSAPNPPNLRNQQVSPGALLARQFVTLLLLMISLAISFTFLFVQMPAPSSSNHATIVLEWPGVRPDMVSAALMPHLAQLGDDGVIGMDQHAAPLGAFAAVPAERALSDSVAAGTPTATTSTPTARPTATVAPTATPPPATPPAMQDALASLALMTINKNIPLAYEGQGGTALLQAAGSPNNTFVVDDQTIYPASLTNQIQAAKLPLLSALPPLDAAHAPDMARTEALTQTFIQVILPHLKSATNFLAVLRYGDPAATATLTGIGSEAFTAALQADDMALGEIITALQNANLYATTNIIVTSDHGLSDVVQPGFSSAATQDYTAPTSAVRTNLAAMLTREAAKGARGALPDVGAAGVTNGTPGKATTVVVTPGGGSDAITFPDTSAVVRLGQGSWATGRAALAQEVAGFLEQVPQVGPIFVNDSLGKPNGSLPLSALGALTASSPDIILSFNALPLDVGQRGTNLATFAGSTPADTTALGTWGTLSRRDMHTIFYAEGPGFLQNVRDLAPTSAADIVQTVAALVGVNLPNTAPGRQMSELLANGSTTGANPTMRVQASTEAVNNGQSYLSVLIFEDFDNIEYLHCGAAIHLTGKQPLNTLTQQAEALAQQE